MKKFLALMALLLCFMVLFVACGDTEEPTEPATEPSTPAPCTHQYDNNCDAICNLCGETRTPAAHVEVTIAAVAPTCTQSGLTAGKKCSVCGKVTEPPQADPAKGHTNEEVKGYAETCTTTGLTDGKKCTVCGETTVAQKTILATGHKLETIEGQAATCTEDGLTVGKRCTVCNETVQAQTVIEQTGHKLATIAAVAPTCTVAGNTEGKECYVCGEIIEATEVVPATGHTVVEFDEIPATCTEPGYTSGTMCSVCGEILSAATETQPKGHKETTLKAVAPTCTESGLTAGKKCSVCGEITVAQEVRPAAHGAEIPMEEVAKTCTTIGYTGGSKCSVCEKVIVAQTVVPASHNYSADCDNECDDCGYQRWTVPAHGIEFGRCKYCGAVDPAYDGIAMSMYDAATVPYDTEKGLYYMKDRTPKSNTTRDGYSWEARVTWALGQDVKGDHVKGVQNAATGFTFQNNQPIRITTNAEVLDLKLFGWAKFGDMAVDTFGMFVDNIDSADDIYFNETFGWTNPASGYLDIFNGTGVLKGSGMETDICTPLGAPNARRFCITFYFMKDFWADLKTQPGEHMIYIVARMADGQLIVVNDFILDVVDHEHTYPAEGSENVRGTVVEATCTEDGYTEAMCLSRETCHGCNETKIINHTPATGHNPDTKWTFVGGTHYHKCLNHGCDVKFDEGKCSGQGTHCDVCGGLYNCDHKYVVDVDGTVKCIGGCGTVKHAAPDYFWTGADLAEKYNSGGFGNYKPTVQDDGTALITGAPADANGGSHVISLAVSGKDGKYIMIVYKSNANHEIWWCNFNPAHQPIQMGATGNDWSVKAYTNGTDHIHGRTDIRFNIKGGADCRTEIAYIALFNDWSAYLAYVNDSITYQAPQVVFSSDEEHGWDEGVVIKESTCSEAGSIKYTCKACGATATVALPLKDHTFSSNVAIVAATCTAEGTKTYTCTVCNAKVVENIEKIPHTEEIIPGVAPTCFNTGLSDGVKCGVCGEVLVERQTVPVADHIYDNACDAYCNMCHTPREVPAHVDADANGVCDVCGVAQGSVESWPLVIGDGFKTTPDFIPGTSIQDPGVSTYYYVYTATTDGIFMVYTVNADVSVFDSEGVLMTIPAALQEGDVVYLSVMSAIEDFDNFDGVTFEVNVYVKGTQQNPFILALGQTTTPEFVPGTSVADPGVKTWYYQYTAEDSVIFTVTEVYNIYLVDKDGFTVEGNHISLKAGETVMVVVDGEFDEENGWTLITDGITFEASVSAECPHKTTKVLPAVPATCTATGLTAGKQCKICGTILVEQEEVPMIAHTEVAIDDVPATCTEDGQQGGVKCGICGVVIEEPTVVPAAHTPVAMDDVAATCGKDGSEGGTICDVCGTIIENPTVIPATGEHSYDEGVVTTETSCSAEGVKTFTCSVCGGTYTETIDKLDHTPVDMDDVAATCGKDGSTGGTKCDVCGAILVAPTTIPAAGEHSYNGVQTFPASCSETGVMTYTCVNCGDKYTETIDKLDHTPVAMQEVAATCVENGSTGGTKCDVCGATIENPTVLLATGHTNVPIPAIPATCVDDGWTEGVQCDVCKDIITAQKRIPASHVYSGDCDSTCDRCGEEREVIADHTFDSNSCTATCTVCGSTKEGTHTLSYGKCTKCGATDPAYAGKALSFQEATDEPYNEDEDLYYFDKAKAKDNCSIDGYAYGLDQDWNLVEGVEGNYLKGQGFTIGEPIKIASNAERLQLKFYGWVAFGDDMKLDRYGFFIDKLESEGDIYYNDRGGFHLDVYNGSGAYKGALSDDAFHADVANNVSPNARRFCIATHVVSNYFWNDLKAQGGTHTIYVVARMEDGQLIVVHGYQIEIVDHACSFPADGTQGVGEVVEPTCVKGGYTECKCLTTLHGCPNTVRINEVEALGHDTPAAWTFSGKTHVKNCTRCGHELASGDCSGANGTTCDTCGGLYNCKHQYAIDDEDGSIVCIAGCGAVKCPAPDYFWSGKQIVEKQQLVSGKAATLQSDGSALIPGAVNGTDTVIRLEIPKDSVAPYVFICYKTSATNQMWFCHYNGTAYPSDQFPIIGNNANNANGHVPLTFESSNSWTAKWIPSKPANTGVVELRRNDGSTADLEIAYIAMFSSWDTCSPYMNTPENWMACTTIG